MAGKMNDPRELFMHELGDILTAERTIEKMLPKLQREAKHDQLAKRIEQHVEETREHVKNVEEVFRKLGEKPKAEKCPAIEGIRADHDELAGEVGPYVQDLLATGAAARTEHYEMAVYTGLVTKAKALGESEAAKLLEQNLKQDQAMAKEIETIAEQLAKAQAKEMAAA